MTTLASRRYQSTPIAAAQDRRRGWPLQRQWRHESHLGGGALGRRTAPQLGALECRRDVGGLIGRADVGAGWDDLVDPVEDLVGQADLDTGEQVIELLHRSRPEDRARDSRVGDREGHREVRYRQARLLGEWDDLLDGRLPGSSWNFGDDPHGVDSHTVTGWRVF
jgi:hypothetical protein